jgi:thiosulfate dehydrogenase
MRRVPRRGRFGATRPNWRRISVPPLWGPDSYNNGAGMSRLLTAAAYAMHNMPIGTAFDAPVLTDEQAYDVAAYIISQKRPE